MNLLTAAPQQNTSFFGQMPLIGDILGLLAKSKVSGGPEADPNTGLYTTKPFTEESNWAQKILRPGGNPLLEAANMQMKMQQADEAQKMQSEIALQKMRNAAQLEMENARLAAAQKEKQEDFERGLLTRSQAFDFNRGINTEDPMAIGAAIQYAPEVARMGAAQNEFLAAEADRPIIPKQRSLTNEGALLTLQNAVRAAQNQARLAPVAEQGQLLTAQLANKQNELALQNADETARLQMGLLNKTYLAPGIHSLPGGGAILVDQNGIGTLITIGQKQPEIKYDKNGKITAIGAGGGLEVKEQGMPIGRESKELIDRKRKQANAPRLDEESGSLLTVPPPTDPTQISFIPGKGGFTNEVALRQTPTQAADATHKQVLDVSKQKADLEKQTNATKAENRKMLQTHAEAVKDVVIPLAIPGHPQGLSLVEFTEDGEGNTVARVKDVATKNTGTIPLADWLKYYNAFKESQTGK